MPAIKRRRTTAAAAVAAKSPAASKGIAAFTRVSKSTITHTEGKKATEAKAVPARAVTGQKRKAEELEVADDEKETEAEVSAILSAAAKKSTSQHFPEPPRTPQKQRAVSISPLKTPTKGARALLERFFISTPENVLREESQALTETTKTEVTSETELPTVPAEIENLLSLHIALLSTLSVHYAHNGINTPVDLRLLYTNISRAWGKRSVSAIDVKRSLGIQNHTRKTNDEDEELPHLTLSDYGHGKICVELQLSARGRQQARFAAPLTEDAMNDAFAQSLASLWRAADTPTSAADVTDFIFRLPQQDVVICDSLVKLSPMIAKGRARLHELKSPSASPRSPRGMSSVRAVDPECSLASEPSTPTPSRFVNKPVDSPKGPSLLERLRAKAKLAESQPPPPTAEETNRRAALHRLEDVVPMVVVLSTSTSRGQSRVSFTMATVTGKIVGSARTPIGVQEARRCVQVLADEVAPEWLRIVELKPAKTVRGKTTAAHEMVVVEREKFPGTEEMKARVRKVLEA